MMLESANCSIKKYEITVTENFEIQTQLLQTRFTSSKTEKLYDKNLYRSYIRTKTESLLVFVSFFSFS